MRRQNESRWVVRRLCSDGRHESDKTDRCDRPLGTCQTAARADISPGCDLVFESHGPSSELTLRVINSGDLPGRFRFPSNGALPVS
jgi:hypothetical protein